MGDRAGYRVREGDEVSNIIRKQWKFDNIKDVVFDVAETLLNSYGTTVTIGCGLAALRDDLGIGRLTAALYHAVYEAPFDSVETDPLGCDIADNGLYEIELVEWNYWKVFNYSIGWKDKDAHLFDRELIAEVRFVEDMLLPSGMEYTEV